VGSHIAQALQEQGTLVRVTVHRRPMPVDSGDFDFCEADLTTAQDCLRAAEGMDFIFHAAGCVGAAGLKGSQVMSAITPNLIMTSLMLEAGWKAGAKRFLLFGSSTGYPVASHPVKEEEMWSGPTFPGYFGYGWMRRYLERLAEFVHGQSEMKIALVRPTAVYGRRDNFDPARGHVIPALVRRALEKEDPFVVWGSGGEVRDFLHVRDLAKGCLLALQAYAECDPVNIGYGRGVTIREVVEIILREADHKRARIVFDASKPTAIPVRVVDTGKARRILGFEPEVSLREGLKDTIEWYRRTVGQVQEKRGNTR